MKNYGQHNALLAGIRHATYAITITLDDDLQNPPEEIPKILGLLEEGYDLVYGYATQQHYSRARGIVTYLTKLCLRYIVGLTLAEYISSYRAFRTNLREAFATFSGPFVSLDMLLAWGTDRVGSIPVAHDVRQHGRSQYSVWRLLRHTIDVVTVYSMRPLQLASWLGFVVTAFGVGLLGFVLIAYATGSPVHGFTFLASIVLFFSGCQLLVLGVFGEYLAHSHFRALGRPAYIVRSELSSTLKRPGVPEVASREGLGD